MSSPEARAAEVIDHAAEIISLATRGAHTTDGRPMKMRDHTAQVIAEALADEGMLCELPSPGACDWFSQFATCHTHPIA